MSESFSDNSTLMKYNQNAILLRSLSRLPIKVLQLSDVIKLIFWPIFTPESWNSSSSILHLYAGRLRIYPYLGSPIAKFDQSGIKQSYTGEFENLLINRYKSVR